MDFGREKARGVKGRMGDKERKGKKEKGGYGRSEMQIEKEGVGHVGTCRDIEVKKVEEEMKV